jgi:hypothetical protein
MHAEFSEFFDDDGFDLDDVEFAPLSEQDFFNLVELFLGPSDDLAADFES